MAFGDTARARRGGNLGTVEGLSQLAISSGLENEVNQILDTTPKLSFLQRISKGLGAFNPAEAILTGTEQGTTAGVAKYIKGVTTGIASAVTGRDIEGERRTFSDVVEKLGIENSIAKFGLGVAGDIFLDPTTYFGGAMAKGLLKGAEIGTEIGLKTVGAVAPKVETGLRLAGTGAKEALGKAFVYGYGTSKGLTDDLLTLETKLDKAKEGIVISNLERLGTQTLSTSQQEELVAKMIEAKRAEFVAGRGIEGAQIARGVLETATPEVKIAIESQIARSQKFAKIAGVQDPYEVYFPFINKDKLSNFLESTRSLRVGSEGYLKQFRNLLTNEQLVTNPVEAFARTEWNIAKNSIVRSELKSLISQYGKGLKDFATEEDALKAGYSLIREKGIFGTPIGYLKELDKKFINNLISPEFTIIDKVAKATGFDALTALFKRSVTGLFLPFHVRNYVSGIIQNFEVFGKDALNPTNIAAGQKLAWKIAHGQTNFPSKIIKVGEKTIDLGKAFKSFVARFGTSSSYIKDIADVTAQGAITKVTSLNPLSAQNIIFRKTRVIGNYIETQQKATAYISALGQGKSIEESLKLAERTGFDYRALTPFESKVLRRIIPFYSFTRKNIELQLRTLGENPERINQIIAIIKNVGEKPSEEENKYLPAYLKNSLGIKISDTPEGLKQYISSFGSPIEAFTDLFNQNFVLKGISMMNPFLKVPLEIGIGKDSFRQKDLKDVYDAKEYKLAPQIIKDLLDVHEIKQPILKKNFKGKLVEIGERTQYVADPIRLLIARSLFTARGVTYLDQIFGGDLHGLTKVLKTTTGLKPQQINLEIQKAITEKEQKRALEDLLVKRGIGKEFKKFYIPKR